MDGRRIISFLSSRASARAAFVVRGYNCSRNPGSVAIICLPKINHTLLPTFIVSAPCRSTVTIIHAYNDSEVDSQFCGSCALARLMCVVALSVAMPLSATAYDLHFDYTSFENSPGKRFQQAHFDVLNYPSINGNYMMTSTDNHRPEMVANGNALAQFYSPFCCATGSDYLDNPRPTAIEEADRINTYTINNSTNNGARPEWVILNEISPSLWQQNPGAPSLNAFRTWAIDVVTRLTDVYGYKVIMLSPYQQLGQTTNAPSWQALANKAYVGIEAYLDGDEVMTGGTDYASRVAYAQGRYQAAKNSYLNVGIPAEKLFVIEHVGNTVEGTNWGRGGIAAADWDQALMIRQDAIYNVNFAGFLTYAWGGNNMNITVDEQIQHEYYYRSRLTLRSEKPQWLSDSAINVNGTVIPLSWSQPLNWKGGVPNTGGAEVNFWRTLTAPRTITLDGTKSVGKITFDSPYSYTISPGTGGSLLLNNSGAAATLTSNQGSHTINTNVQVIGNLNAAINTGTFLITGALSGSGALTKSGAGTLTLSGGTSYSGHTTVQGGTLRISTASLPNAADVFLSTGATLHLNFTGSPDAIDSLFINGVAQYIGIWGAVGSGAEFTSPLFAGTGRVHVTNGPLPGDFNLDGMVDAADYLVWRKKFGSPYTQTDYNTWRSRFGQGGGGGAGGAVPEPATYLFCGLALLAVFVQRMRT
jgi:autotransporter-associated beta strand protein